MSDRVLLSTILKAYNDPGPHPEFHKRVKQSLRVVWPTLADALDLATLWSVVEP